VIIDRSHRSWALGSALALTLAVIVYIPYASGDAPARGGSPLGLAYGIAGFGAMAIVTLLSLRKRFPIWRIGRTQAWMRAHLWLGALSLPLILLHAGFLSGHGLTSVLLWLFAGVYASGIFGAWLQHTVPARIMRDVPMETIYDQIARVREQLVDEADTVVADASGKLQISVAVPSWPAEASAKAAWPAEVSAKAAANALASVMRIGADDAAPLREFYTREMRPFVEKPTRAHPLADETTAAVRFGKLRPLVPPALAAAITDLESICEEERQLQRQERMHRLLHGWLVIHVPLSFALMALAVVHIVMALQF
jgi:hypothetical protein